MTIDRSATRKHIRPTVRSKVSTAVVALSSEQMTRLWRWFRGLRHSKDEENSERSTRGSLPRCADSERVISRGRTAQRTEQHAHRKRPVDEVSDESARWGPDVSRGRRTGQAPHCCHPLTEVERFALTADPRGHSRKRDHPNDGLRRVCGLPRRQSTNAGGGPPRRRPAFERGLGAKVRPSSEKRCGLTGLS